MSCPGQPCAGAGTLRPPAPAPIEKNFPENRPPWKALGFCKKMQMQQVVAFLHLLIVFYRESNSLANISFETVAGLRDSRQSGTTSLS